MSDIGALIRSATAFLQFAPHFPIRASIFASSSAVAILMPMPKVIPAINIEAIPLVNIRFMMKFPLVKKSGAFLPSP
jgi:hypothetical protein